MPAFSDDIWAQYSRPAQRHCSKNVPGAGGAVLANQLFMTARRDGTAIGQLQRTLLLDPLLIQHVGLAVQAPSRLNSAVEIEWLLINSGSSSNVRCNWPIAVPSRRAVMKSWFASTAPPATGTF